MKYVRACGHICDTSLAALAAVDSACASSSDSRVMAASGPTSCMDVIAALPFFLDKIAEFLGRGCPVSHTPVTWQRAINASRLGWHDMSQLHPCQNLQFGLLAASLDMAPKTSAAAKAKEEPQAQVRKVAKVNGKGKGKGRGKC